VWLAALGMVALLTLALAIAFFPFIVEIVNQASDGLTQIQAQLSQSSAPTTVGAALGFVFDSAKNAFGDAFGALVGQIASAATVVILAIFLVFFLLRDGDKAWLWVFQGISDRNREDITASGREALGRVAGYVRGTTLLALIYAATDFVFLVLLGIPLALPLAILVFLLSFIPYFGGLVATVLLLLIGWHVGGATTALVLLVLISIRSFLVSYWIRPLVYSRAVHLHPALVLLVLPAGYQVAGIIGLFVAVPATATVLTLARSGAKILGTEREDELPIFVPGWLDRLAQYSWRILVIVGLAVLGVGLVLLLPLVVIPIVGGLILSATVDPLVDILTKRGWTRGRAAAISILGGILFVAAMLGLAVASLAGNAPAVGDAVTSGGQQINNAAGGQLQFPEMAVAATSLVTVRTVAGALEALATIGVLAVLSALLAFYFTRDAGSLWARAAQHMPTAAANELAGAGRRAFSSLGGYMLGTAAISLAGAVTQWLIMVVLGLPFALPVLVLSFFLGFIPYIGGYLTTGMAFLITVQYGSTLDIAVMFVWTMAFNIVQGNILAPIFYGKTVHIHPAIVLLAIPAGGAVAGIAGMFLAVPVAGVIAASWRSVLAVLGLPRSGDQEPILEEPPPEPAPQGGLNLEPQALPAS